MSMTASIIALVILLAALLLMRRTQKSIGGRPSAKRPTRPVVGKPAITKFHAVSIRLSNSACEAARELQGQRFLASEAPHFPLDECDAPQCRCRFAHFKDRRATDDRRNPYRGTMGGSTGNLEQEQRTGGDRRKHPHDEF